VTNGEAITLAYVIIERTRRYEEIVLGMHLRGLCEELELRWLTGPRRQAAVEWDRVLMWGSKWSSASVKGAALRASLYSKLAEEEFPDALHFLPLRDASDAVLDALLMLEASCSRLVEAHRFRLLQGSARPAARSGEAVADEPLPESGNEDAATPTPATEEKSSGFHAHLGPEPHPGHSGRNDREAGGQ